MILLFLSVILGTAVLLLLFTRTEISLTARLWSRGPEADGEARLLFGLIKLRLYAKLVYRNGRYELMLKVMEKESSVPLGGGKGERVALPLSILHIRYLLVKGCVGIKDELFAAYMIAGTLSAALHTASAAAVGVCAKVSIEPVYDRNAFWLYVEGIADVWNAQIIGAALRGDFKRRNKDNGASHRKHNKEQHGADTRHGGCEHGGG